MHDPNENRTGYKETKVGWIPSTWKGAPLRDLVTIQSGHSPSEYALAPSGSHPFVQVDDLNRCTVWQKAAKQFTDDSVGLVPAQAVLFAKRGAAIATNKVRLSRCPLVMDTNMMALIPDTLHVHPLFLFYTILHQNLYRIADTSPIPQINNKHINPHRIPLPPLPEQEKIADILSTWDAAIEQTRDLIAAKKQQKKALMQQLLSGKRRLPGFEGEWDECRLGSVFTERRETNGDHLPLLAITGQRGIIPASEIDRKDSSNADKSRYKVIRVGDLGYNTMRMWQGVNAISTLEGIVSPAYTIATPHDCLNGPFLAHYFKFQPVVHKFYRYSQGLVSDTWNLKFPHFAEIRIPFPALDEQRAIAAVLDTADSEINSLQEQLEAFQQQKKGLMQRLLTGQVRVKV